MSLPHACRLPLAALAVSLLAFTGCDCGGSQPLPLELQDATLPDGTARHPYSAGVVATGAPRRARTPPPAYPPA
ncbi:MAG TPA: hypothetical protein VFB81_18180 [Myxococcales bacterium]|nr:hypothetical protein [Myxococcales bacterium]